MYVIVFNNSFSFSDVFAAQDVDLPMFLTLDDADLKELGIKIFGHRKKILMAIKGLCSLFLLPWDPSSRNSHMEMVLLNFSNLFFRDAHLLVCHVKHFVDLP